MPINQFIPTQAPGLGQTPTGAGLGAAAQVINNAYQPGLLKSQMFENQMFPLAIMSQSPDMWTSKGYAQLFGHSLANAINQLHGTNYATPAFAAQQGTANALTGAVQGAENYVNPPPGTPGANQSLLDRLVHGFIGAFGGNSTPSNTSQGAPSGALQTTSGAPHGYTPSSNTMVPANQQTQNIIRNVVQQNGLTQLNDIGGGWYTAYQNGHPVKFQMPGLQ